MDGCDIVVGATAMLQIVGALEVIGKALVAIAVVQVLRILLRAAGLRA